MRETVVQWGDSRITMSSTVCPAALRHCKLYLGADESLNHELASRILEARIGAHLTQEAFAEAIHVSVSSVSQYESGRITPRLPTLKRIAGVTGRPLSWFFSSDEGAQVPRRRRIRGRKAPPHAAVAALPADLHAAVREAVREEVHRVISLFPTSGAHPNEVSSLTGESAVILVPLYDEVPAGVPTDALQTAQGSVFVPREWTRGGTVFCLKVSGHSMEPLIMDGDVIAVRRQPSAESGSIVLASVPGVAEIGDYTIKRLRKRGRQVVLEPLNPAYETILPTGPVAVEGLVVGLIRSLAR